MTNRRYRYSVTRSVQRLSAAAVSGLHTASTDDSLNLVTGAAWDVYLGRMVPVSVPFGRELRLWRLMKDGGTAEAVLRSCRDGYELQIMVNGERFWSQLFRFGADSRLVGELSIGCRQDFVRWGWVEAGDEIVITSGRVS